MTILSEVRKENMKIFNKECVKCKSCFIASGPAGRFCEICAKEHKRERAANNSYQYKLRKGLIKNPGVGSGNNQGFGENHHSFTTGIGCFFQDKRAEIKKELRFCEVCKKDLIGAGRYFWSIHHKDHDRTNNSRDNLTLLCKRCHQIEHDCHLAFSKTCND